MTLGPTQIQTVQKPSQLMNLNLLYLKRSRRPEKTLLLRKRLTESSLPGVANGVSLPKVEYFHNREVADDDRRTERPLAGHHRQADGERSERGGILPGGTHPRGSILFLAPQIQ